MADFRFVTIPAVGGDVQVAWPCPGVIAKPMGDNLTSLSIPGHENLKGALTVMKPIAEVLALLAGGKAEGGYVYKASESEKALLADGRALAIGDVTQKLRKLLEEYRNYTDDFVVWRVCEGLNVTLGDLRRLVGYLDKEMKSHA